MADPVPTDAAQPAPPAAPERVPVYNRSGRLVTIPAAQLEAAKAQGYSQAPPQAAAAEAEDPTAYEAARAKGESIPRAAISALGSAGAAQGAAFLGSNPLIPGGSLIGHLGGFVLPERQSQAMSQAELGGLTAGLGHVAVQKLAGVLARAQGQDAADAESKYANLIKSRAEEFPITHGVGEAAGMTAGTLATGGLGAAAKLAPMGLVEAAGGAAEGLTARAAARLAAKGALGRAGGAALNFAARGAAENAVYSGINEMSEEMLGKDHELNGEKMLAAAGSGALSGAVFGGALGAGGSLAASGLGAARTGLSDIASKGADRLEQLANEQRWKALNPAKRFTEEAERRIPGGTKAVGDVLGKYGITGETVGQAAQEGHIQAIAPKIDTAIDKVGARIGELQGLSQGTVPWKSIDEAFEASMGDLRKQAGREGVVESLDKYRNSLEQKLGQAGGVLGNEGGIPLQDVLFQRKALDNMIYDETRALDPNMRVKMLRTFRGKFEDLIMKGFDEAADTAGAEATKLELRGLKRDYQALSLAQDAAENTTSAMMTNRNFSMSDYLAGGALSHTFGLPGALAGGAINRFGRQRGNAIAAAMADRLAAFGGKTRLITALPEAGEALAREAAAAEGKKAGEVIASVLPTPDLTQGEAKDFQEAITPKTLEELGAHKGEFASKTSKGDLMAASMNVFGDRAPSTDFIRSMYKVPEGYHVRFTDIGTPTIFDNNNTKAIMFNGEILNKNGNPVGEFNRTFNRDADGKLVAHHEYLSLDKDAQGKGIGTELQKSSIEAYHKLGVDRIEMTAGLDAGPYAWARQGYQWGGNAQDEMTRTADLFGRAHDLEPDQIQKLKDAIAQSPRAVSEVEHNGRRLGKDFLLESGGYEAQMPVEAAHAEMLAKAAEFQRAQDAIKKLDEHIDSAAKGIVEGPSLRKSAYREPPSERTIKARFEEARDRIAEAQANPQAIVQAAAQTSRYLPRTTQAMNLSAVRSMQYLSGQLPAPAGKPALGSPAPPRVSDQDMAAFLEKDRVAKDPTTALKTFAAGRMTVGMAVTLQAVSPKMFDELRAKALQIVQEKQASGDPLPFDARQRMSILLGIVTDPSQDPTMMAALQGNLQPEQGQPAMAGGGKSPKPPKPKTPGVPSVQSKYNKMEES